MVEKKNEDEKEIAYIAVKPEVKKTFEELRGKENTVRELPANEGLSQSEFEALLLEWWEKKAKGKEK